MLNDSEEDDRYFKATREDLLHTLSDPSRVQVALDIVAPLKVEYVLDVGCGIGQALFPLAVSKEAYGVGIDVSEIALRMGRAFYADYLPQAKVGFVRGRAEALPFASNSFDVVNFGLALPYTHNTLAIAEVARVLRQGGVFLLKIHHARYYLREIWRGMMAREISSVVYGGRVLTAGLIYHVARRQPRVRFLNESFQTRWLLRRELAKHGLDIHGEQANSNPQTPAFIIYKKK